ncbi:MAG: excinuclease ABC subunit UvrC [Myxococcales bacterium]|nr:excinuclease ABC subunit UvrC [Myxococcales bacterium]
MPRRRDRPADAGVATDSAAAAKPVAASRGRSRATAPSDSAVSRRASPNPQTPEDFRPRIVDEATLLAALERLPPEPGVYIMRDRKGEVVYVGKARSLRARVRQYFNGTDTRLFVPMLAKLVGDIETVVVANEKEALLLENNLIKEQRPRFNVKLRDDANYLVLRLDPKSKWPRLELVRHVGHDGAWFFGPYHSARSVRATLRVVNRHFKLRTCTDFVLGHRTRPCLQYQIGRCPAPCVHDVDAAAYGDQVGDVRLFLSGRHRELIEGLEGRMATAAEDLEFETAARLRDQLHAIGKTLQSQQIVGTTDVDQDAVGMYREGGQVEFVVMQVREGKLQQTQGYSQKGMELPDADVLGSFLAAYYDKAAFVPDEVILPHALHEDDAAPLLEWLRDRKGRKVSVAVPERGDRRKLLALANKNAASNFATRRDKREDSELALSRLQQRLGLSKLPRVMECYDVSHIQGSDTVASMVTFVDGVPEKSRYRSFKIRGLGTDPNEAALAQGNRQNDDFASMYEVLGRRFQRALSGTDRGDEDDAWSLPDLVVIDGGKGQLGQVLAAMNDLGVPIGAEGVDVVSLAKERRSHIGRGRAAVEKLRERRGASTAQDGEAEAAAPGTAWIDYVVEQATTDNSTDSSHFEVRPERVFVPGTKDAIVLKPGSSERYLMERVRDEAHRFAIGLHRKRRGKRALHSSLDDIEGIGPAIKRALVKHFGSIAAIRSADVDALCQVKGIGRALAERIREALGSA